MRILKDINSDSEFRPCPNDAFMQFSFDDLMKEYVNGFHVHVTAERLELRMRSGSIGRHPQWDSSCPQ